jgi:hypothetical protein
VSGSKSTTTTSSTSTTSTTLPLFNIKYNARSDVTSSLCEDNQGTWKYSGQIHNSFKVAKRYEVVAEFTHRSTDVVAATRVIKVSDLGSGATHHWTVGGPSQLENLNCVVLWAMAWSVDR